MVASSAYGAPVAWVVCAAVGVGYEVVGFGAVGLAADVVVEGAAAEGAVGYPGGFVSPEYFCSELEV